jgi:hypothetical protein
MVDCLEDRCRWGHKCTTDKEIGWQGVECYNLSQDRDQLWVLVNMVMNLQAPYNVGKYLDQLKNYDL